MSRRRKDTSPSILRDAAYGAIGGVIGSYALEKVSEALYEREAPDKRQREEQLRKEPPFMVLAERLIHQAGLDVTPERKERLGKAIHWSYGMAWGALYGALRRRVPVLSRAGGLLFGVGFAIVGDELMSSVMGLTAPPKEFPVDAHVRGLLGHVAFTAATDGTVRCLEAVTP